MSIRRHSHCTHAHTYASALNCKFIFSLDLTKDAMDFFQIRERQVWLDSRPAITHLVTHTRNHMATTQGSILQISTVVMLLHTSIIRSYFISPCKRFPRWAMAASLPTRQPTRSRNEEHSHKRPQKHSRPQLNICFHDQQSKRAITVKLTNINTFVNKHSHRCQQLIVIFMFSTSYFCMHLPVMLFISALVALCSRSFRLYLD